MAGFGEEDMNTYLDVMISLPYCVHVYLLSSCQFYPLYFDNYINCKKKTIQHSINVDLFRTIFYGTYAVKRIRTNCVYKEVKGLTWFTVNILLCFGFHTAKAERLSYMVMVRTLDCNNHSLANINLITVLKLKQVLKH